MENCVKCGKEFKTKDLFLQWFELGETYICKDCIKKHKTYLIDPCYAGDSDITFVMVRACVLIGKDVLDLSQTLIGYHYGNPDDEDSKKLEELMLKEWLTGDKKIRKDLLRQNFNENQKDEEVLY